MKRITEVLMAILFMAGVVVTLTYVILSFFGYAIISWTIIVITVFAALIYEIYGEYVE
jgi:hypothetical protein